MKCVRDQAVGELPDVAPRAGAWIEILRACHPADDYGVAPRAGAWIEMITEILPEILELVAPRAGAWIEMVGIFFTRSKSSGRSPCGSVD